MSGSSLSLPIPEFTQVQILSLIGLVLSALLDCEIQTISRELVSIPNSWLITWPTATASPFEPVAG